jgi:hypothetical protein
MTWWTDLARLSEDNRIQMIGHRAVKHRERVGFVLEADEPEKIKRYKEKLLAKFPELCIVDEGYLDQKKVLWIIYTELKPS